MGQGSFWNERYAHTGYAYGTIPNAYLKEKAAGLAAGLYFSLRKVKAGTLCFSQHRAGKPMPLTKALKVEIKHCSLRHKTMWKSVTPFRKWKTSGILKKNLMLWH